MVTLTGIPAIASIFFHYVPSEFTAASPSVALTPSGPTVGAAATSMAVAAGPAVRC